MATKQDISFGGPAAVIAPDLVVEQQKWQRTQALIDALRERSLQPIDGGRGRISWTQGLAQLMSALAAKKMQGRNDERLMGINRGFSDRMRGQFGLPSVAGTPAPAAPAQPPIQLKPETQAMLTPEAQAGLAAVNGQAATAPQAMPPQGAPGAPSSYPMSLSGNPQQDFNDWAMNPEHFSEKLIDAHAPVDFARQLAQSGIDPASPLGRQIMQSQIAKQNYIAPINGRPGSTIRDPNDPSKILGYDAPNIEGAVPVYGPDGMPTGYQQLPGATAAMAQAAGAKSGGEAAGKSPFELVQVYDEGGNAFYMPKAALLQGGNAGGPNGSLARAAAPPGSQAAFNVTGTNSANGFQQISDMGADVPNRLLALRSMQTLANDPKSVFGKGSEGWNKTAGYLGTLTGGERPNVTNANEFNKWAAQYSARSAQELGLSGSDSRVQLAVHATPNGEMTRGALQTIIPQMIGLENAKAGMATAAVQWQQAYGPASLQQFRTTWNRVYDPRIYTWMSQGPKVFAANVQRLPPAERAAMKAKYVELKRIGALPQ